MPEKKPSKRSKYAPGKTLLIPMDRIRVYPRALCKVPPEEMRELLSVLRSKYSHRGEWYQEIPPIKARYVPKFSSLNIVLVEGVEHYQTAKTLGLYEIKCTTLTQLNFTNKIIPNAIAGGIIYENEICYRADGNRTKICAGSGEQQDRSGNI